MKKKIAAALVLALSSTALAGTKVNAPVVVETTDAHGSLGSARDSADGVQWIACVTYETIGFCGAQDAAGTMKGCTFTDPNLLQQARSINGDSSIYFAWDSSGVCMTLKVWSGSYLAPKSP
jgi:hypothetical protein